MQIATAFVVDELVMEKGGKDKKGKREFVG